MLKATKRTRGVRVHQERSFGYWGLLEGRLVGSRGQSASVRDRWVHPVGPLGWTWAEPRGLIGSLCEEQLEPPALRQLHVADRNAQALSEGKRFIFWRN